MRSSVAKANGRSGCQSWILSCRANISVAKYYECTVWILKCVMCLSCVPYTCARVRYVDGGLIQKFECTVPQLCRVRVIYDEVVLWGVPEVTVFSFFQTVLAWLDIAGGCWLFTAQYREGIHESCKKPLKTPWIWKFFCRYTCHGAERLYTKVLKYTIKTP